MSAFNTKKADFLPKLAGMTEPRVYTRSCSVYLCDGRDSDNSIEIYCASTMTEEGYISAANQCSRFRRWIGEAA